ncbi:ATP-grasp domain-containing protein [Winogradskyella sp.]|uniref:ATP-grasp domain-containing protein n=1 Tax=Winogradskyella sp. TaxID=1883156 RepID=UPI0026292298|nr:ATP-grasp domain-containing protein [Winogradskyella sp.]
MKSNLKNISILIPDGETTLLSHVVYSLALIKYIKIYVLSSHKTGYFEYSLDNNCFKHSRFIEKFVYYEKTTTEAWINKIDNTVEVYDIDLIMPIFDLSTDKLLKHIDLLKSRTKLCYLSSHTNFETALRKDLLCLFLKSNHLPCPDSIIVSSKFEYEAVDIDFPIVAKPTYGFEGGMGVKLVSNKEELLNYIKINKTDSPLLLQEFVEGFDVSCNVLCKKGKLLAYTMQKGITMAKGIKVTPQHEFKFFHDDTLLGLMEDLMKSLNWSGVANIDFRFDQTNTVYKVIEINPRFWLNTEASALAGVNFPYLYCLSTLNRSIEFIPVKKGTFLHLKALAKRLKRKPFFIFKFNYLLNNTPFIFIIKDPIVIWCKFIWRTNNIISSKFLKKKKA